MIQLSIPFERHVVPLTYIDINIDIVYFLKSTIITIRWHSKLERQSNKREVVGSIPAAGKTFFVILAFFAWLTAGISKYK